MKFQVEKVSTQAATNKSRDYFLTLKIANYKTDPFWSGGT